MDLKQNTVFERPVGGSYLGTIIDVVDMPNVQSTYNGQTRMVNKIRIHWILSHINGAPYLTKEGKPQQATGFYTASVSDKSKLTKLLQQIFQGQALLFKNTEELALALIGRSNGIFLTQSPDNKNPGQFITEVAGLSPVPPGVVPPQRPADYVRFKDRPKQTSGPFPGQTIPTYAQPPATNAQPPMNNVSFAQPTATAAPQPAVGGQAPEAF